MLTLLASSTRWTLTDMAGSDITDRYGRVKDAFLFPLRNAFDLQQVGPSNGHVWLALDRRGSTPAAVCARCAAPSDMTEDRCKATTTNLGGSGRPKYRGCIVKAPLDGKSNNALTWDVL